MFIDVKNKKGTADRLLPTGYSTWLDFWEKRRQESYKIAKQWFVAVNLMSGVM